MPQPTPIDILGYDIYIIAYLYICVINRLGGYLCRSLLMRTSEWKKMCFMTSWFLICDLSSWPLNCGLCSLSAYCGGMWLAGLKMTALMADHLGLTDDCQRFNDLLEKAKRSFEEKLWNGERPTELLYIEPTDLYCAHWSILSPLIYIEPTDLYWASDRTMTSKWPIFICYFPDLGTMRTTNYANIVDLLESWWSS